MTFKLLQKTSDYHGNTGIQMLVAETMAGTRLTINSSMSLHSTALTNLQYC